MLSCRYKTSRCGGAHVHITPPAPACQQQRKATICTAHADSKTRRSLLFAISLAPITAGAALPAFALTEELLKTELEVLQDQAYTAYANRDFTSTTDFLTRIISRDGSSPRWHEMRAQVAVDAKQFENAVQDFNTALSLTPESSLVDQARLKSGRALAYEGLADWRSALKDYDNALDMALKGGESPDPYVINSRGNCYNSLGMWQEAREDYLLSSQLFQQAKGFRGRGGSTTQRLDGAIFSASNAALMRVQLGDVPGAVSEMVRIARRAPGSADMRAALAALYWSQGNAEAAEDEWNFACDQISVGCSKYQDSDWLRRIRRWPPVMVEKMQDFVQLKTRQAAAS